MKKLEKTIVFLILLLLFWALLSYITTPTGPGNVWHTVDECQWYEIKDGVERPLEMTDTVAVWQDEINFDNIASIPSYVCRFKALEEFATLETPHNTFKIGLRLVQDSNGFDATDVNTDESETEPIIFAQFSDIAKFGRFAQHPICYMPAGADLKVSELTIKIKRKDG